MPDQEQQLGRIVSVSGSQIVFLHEGYPSEYHANAAEKNGQGLQIGSLVKMQTDGSTVFGMVSGLSIPVPARNDESQEMKIVEIELLGETAMNGQDAHQGSFQRGVSTFPGLGDAIYASDRDDLSRVYARPEASTVAVGRVHQDQNVPAYVLTDDLLGKHFAVLGTTGCGKSCAVALILRAILEQNANAHVVLLDPHNEYARTFGEQAEILSPENLQLPYWLLTFEEMVEVVLGDSNDCPSGAEAILNEAIPEAKQQYLKEGEPELSITVDTPVPYRLTDLLQIIDDKMGKLDKPEDCAPYLRLKSRLNALKADRRFAFMFGGLTVRDNMTDILSRILRIPVDGKPVTIMDLSGIPSEILNVVVSIMCRLTFDFALWSERAVPVLLVCEEAHRYAPQNSELGFEPTKRALSRIAKEGRKYGVSLCVVSQRPSELATGMLSQCNTIFAMRMSNQNDQDFVRAAMSESATGLMDFLPSLHIAEAIAVGEGVPLPVRVSFDHLPEEHRPRSGTARFSAAWKQQSENGEDKAFLNEVVSRWRRQRR
ncbi:MAG: DUF87 domain-containing protein [Kiloniellales bacterium]|nr:DUF87 domain-containing protein [Kiloniellales bacterium]